MQEEKGGESMKSIELIGNTPMAITTVQGF